MVVKIEILLSHEEFVRALSRRLVIDEHLVDDVVQETWLAALERPPRSAGALRAWLGTVARNFIFSMGRDDRRRVLRERRARKTDGAPSPAEIVERESARRCLVESVLDLDAIYRDPILLRYYEDRPPREIAKRLNLPVETVRTRIKRGLAQLRKNLDTYYGGDGRSWCLALLLVSGLEKKFVAPGLWAAIVEKIPGLMVMNASRVAALGALGLLTATAIFVAVFLGRDEEPPALVAATRQSAAPIADRFTVAESPPAPIKKIESVPKDQRNSRPENTRVASPDSPEKSRSAPASRAGDRNPRRVKLSHPGLETEAPHNMVRIPAGETSLGMDEKEVRSFGEGESSTLSLLSASIPTHTVPVNAFYCDRFEVTNAQWAHFLAATGRKPSCPLVELSWRGKTHFPAKEERFPVRNVDLDDARAYARWHGKRLPTEAEWMRAASADKGTLYSWGNEYDPAKCSTRATHSRREKLMPVGSHPGGVSPFGVHDMTGSVWEWTETAFEAYEGFEPIAQWVGRRKEILSPGFDADYFVVKGGVYNGNELVNLLAVRQRCLANTNLDSLGFRCVKDVEPGLTQFNHVKADLARSDYAGLELLRERSFFVEAVEECTGDPHLTPRTDSMLIAPLRSIPATKKEIEKESPRSPQVIGVLSTTVPLDDPSLPRGTYILAYRHRGGSPHVSTDAPAGKTDRTIDLPRNRSLIVFMNPNGVIAGYADGRTKFSRSRHNGVEAKMGSRISIQLWTEIAPPYSARFKCSIRIEDNLFRE